MLFSIQEGVVGLWYTNL